MSRYSPTVQLRHQPGPNVGTGIAEAIRQGFGAYGQAKQQRFVEEQAQLTREQQRTLAMLDMGARPTDSLEPGQMQPRRGQPAPVRADVFRGQLPGATEQPGGVFQGQDFGLRSPQGGEGIEMQGMPMEAQHAQGGGLAGELDPNARPEMVGLAGAFDMESGTFPIMNRYAPRQIVQPQAPMQPSEYREIDEGWWEPRSGGGGAGTSEMQNIEYMVNTLGMTPEDAANHIYELGGEENDLTSALGTYYQRPTPENAAAALGAGASNTDLTATGIDPNAGLMEGAMNAYWQNPTDATMAAAFEAGASASQLEAGGAAGRLDIKPEFRGLAIANEASWDAGRFIELAAEQGINGADAAALYQQALQKAGTPTEVQMRMINVLGRAQISHGLFYEEDGETLRAYPEGLIPKAGWKELFTRAGVSDLGSLTQAETLNDEQRLYLMNASGFLTAILRVESGAAISATEFDKYGQIFLPMPKDPKSILELKARYRQSAIDGLKAGVQDVPAYMRQQGLNVPDPDASMVQLPAVEPSEPEPLPDYLLPGADTSFPAQGDTGPLGDLDEQARLRFPNTGY